MGEQLQFAEVLPNERERPEPHIRLPSLGVLCSEDEPPKHLSLKASRASKSQRVVGNRDSTLKGHTQNLTHSGTQVRSSNLKRSWVRMTC